jgi:hypothetical protein
LPITQYTRNAWLNTTTKKTPFELIMGYVPRAHQPSRQMDIPNVDQRMKHIKEVREAAQDAISKSQDALQKETRSGWKEQISIDLTKAKNCHQSDTDPLG